MGVLRTISSLDTGLPGDEFLYLLLGEGGEGDAVPFCSH